MKIVSVKMWHFTFSTFPLHSPLTAVAELSPRESLLINGIVIFPGYVLSVSLMCALKLMRSGSPLGELAPQASEGGGIRREYGLSLLVLLIICLIPITPLSPLSRCSPGRAS